MDIKKEMIAPCGMNCALCVSYQSGKYELSNKGINRKACPGCILRGKHCTHMSKHCSKAAKGEYRFCFECGDYPCERLKALDKRYSEKYHMSMIENLNYIRDNGIDAFLKEQSEKWKCPDCGDIICCHNGLCLNCHLETLKNNPKYRWGKR
jgi:hypothetical protein